MYMYIYIHICRYIYVYIYIRILYTCGQTHPNMVVRQFLYVYHIYTYINKYILAERPGSRGLTQGLGAKLARRPRRAPVESLARQWRTPRRALRRLVNDVKKRGSERCF